MSEGAAFWKATPLPPDEPLTAEKFRELMKPGKWHLMGTRGHGRREATRRRLEHLAAVQPGATVAGLSDAEHVAYARELGLNFIEPRDNGSHITIMEIDGYRPPCSDWIRWRFIDEPRFQLPGNKLPAVLDHGTLPHLLGDEGR